jgi:ferric-dicitrate binding protein FerR (iron transport regulator)
MENKYDILLAKYFGGNATQSEMDELEAYVAASPENQKEFDKLTELYGLMGLSDRQIPEINSAKAKSKFKTYIGKQNSEKPKNTFFLNRFTFSTSLILRVASVAIIILVSTLVWKNIFADNEIIISSNTAIQHHILPNNTKLTLAENSKISYRVTKNSNIIDLQGKANFNVVNKGKTSLLVTAGETFIEDIGTVFNVNAYPESELVSVSVSEGQVHFYTSDNQGLILNAGEAGIFNKSTKAFTVLAKRKDLKNNGTIHIEFEAMSLNDALSVIGNAYGVEIELPDKNVGNLPITVNFDGENIQTVMQVISETLNLKTRMKGEVYQLYGAK